MYRESSHILKLLQDELDNLISVKNRSRNNKIWDKEIKIVELLIKKYERVKKNNKREVHNVIK